VKLRRVLVAAAAFAATVGLSASPAAAATVNPGDIHEVWTTISGPVGTKVGGYVSCPAGMKVVSAGGGNAQLASLTTTTDGNGAYASGVLTNPGAPYLPLQAECVPAAALAGSTVATITVNDHRRPVGGYALFSATAKCPAGSYAFGGGGYFTTQSGVSMYPVSMQANAPTADGTGWTFAAYARRGNDTLNVRTQCAPAPTSSFLVSATYPVPTTGTRTAQGYANCPAGHMPLSGGAYLTNPDDIQSNLFYSDAVRNPSPYLSGWYASATGSPSATGAALHVITRCL
jgi:hypothetical protein